MKFKILPVLIITLLVTITIGVVVVMKKKTSPAAPVESTTPSLPINAIPVEERPYIFLTPDLSAHNLTLHVENAPEGTMEYELLYNTQGKQDGIFGRLTLTPAPQDKVLLMGSKSAGGKVTYYEGVTGGSLTVTYSDTRLKESFNFLSFDPKSPTISSTDSKFTVKFADNAYKAKTPIITMKTFGLPKALPTGKLIVGPYTFTAPLEPKGELALTLTLPAGEHVNPTIYEYDGESWVKLTTKLSGDNVTGSSLGGNLYVVVAD